MSDEADTLGALLFQEPYRFDFHQAVKLLGLLARNPAARPPGEALDPANETVRFRSAIDSDFPASQIQDLVLPVDNGPPELTVRFFGLLGNQGPLPLPITELAQRATRSGDTALRDFLDLFHHRLLSLFHNVRERHRVGLENGPPEQHRLARHLRAFMGMATTGLAGRLHIPDKALLRGAGLLAHRTRSLPGLKSLLESYFGVPIEVRPFVGAWSVLDEDQRTSIALGVGFGRARNNELGVSVVIGNRVWDQAARVGILVGPIRLDKYLDFLPGRPGHVALGELATFFLGATPTFDLALELHKDEVPIAPLGDGRSTGPLLGWTSFLMTNVARTHNVTISVAAR